MNVKDAYKILGATSSDSHSTIRDKYHKLVLKHHPDKGGCADIFCNINEAYKVIEKQENTHASHNTSCSQEKKESTVDIFKSFLKTHLQNKLFKDYKNLYLTLEEMYTGKVIKINMTKYIDCEHCNKQYCSTCSGTGKIKHEIILLSIKQYLYVECDKCDGFGYNRICNICEDGYVEQHNVYTLKIKRGCQIDDKYSIDNNATIFVIKQYKHPRFHRCENDLILHKSISLYDAVACKKIKCKHLNGKVYTFSNKDTIQSDVIYQLDALGMPLKNSKSYGNLYIKFDIILPSRCELTYDESKIIKKLFDITNHDDDFSNCTDNIELKKSNEDYLDKNLLRFIRVSS